MFNENSFIAFKESLGMITNVLNKYVADNFVPSDFKWYLERLYTDTFNLLVDIGEQNER